MVSETKKCAHPACNCEVDADTKYCSTYCHDAGSTTEISCGCAHAGCAIGDAETIVAGAGSSRHDL